MIGQRRVLVTGGSGFIGCHAVPLLRQRGFEVHVVGRDQADLLSPGVPASVVTEIQPTHLLHLAWNATPGRFWNAPDNLDWVAASLALHRAFAAVGGKRAVFAGTCAEYDGSDDLLDERTSPCAPATPYGIAKDTLRRLLMTFPCGISVAWGRIFHLYGPHEARARLVPEVVTSLLAGRPALCGEGLIERDFMHVADVAAALVALLASEVEGPVNIASGVCCPVREVINKIASQLEQPGLVRLGARTSSSAEPQRIAALVNRLRDDVGFQPAHSLDEGLADTIAWWRAHQPGPAPKQAASPAT